MKDISDYVAEVSKHWDRKALEKELEEASAKIVEQAAEIRRLKTKLNIANCLIEEYEMEAKVRDEY